MKWGPACRAPFSFRPVAGKTMYDASPRREPSRGYAGASQEQQCAPLVPPEWLGASRPPGEERRDWKVEPSAMVSVDLALRKDLGERAGHDGDGVRGSPSRRGVGGPRLAVRGALSVWVRKRCCRGACCKGRSRPARRSRSHSTRLSARACGADLALVRGEARKAAHRTSPVLKPIAPKPQPGAFSLRVLRDPLWARRIRTCAHGCLQKR